MDERDAGGTEAKTDRERVAQKEKQLQEKRRQRQPDSRSFSLCCVYAVSTSYESSSKNSYNQ